MTHHSAVFADFVQHSSELAALTSYLGDDITIVTSQLVSYFSSEASTESFTPDKLPPHIQSLESDTRKAGLSAIDKALRQGITTTLSPDETNGLEAIILLSGRPALFIQGGRVMGTTVGWEVLEDQHDAIQQHIPGVGRIEIRIAPNSQWNVIGTGFLVAENVVMTNRHVVTGFCRAEDNGIWHFNPGYEARIDFLGEIDITNTSAFTLQEPIGVHSSSNCDLALLCVERVSDEGMSLPRPLPLASQVSESLAERMVYTIGYPVRAGDPREQLHAQRIFANQFGYKRLLPGRIAQYISDDQMFTHNCTTLKGSSGSPVIDLDTHLVLGLHFRGGYLAANSAVALWTLRNDPLLAEMGVLF